MDSTDANDGIDGGIVGTKELDHALMVEMASVAGSDLGFNTVSIAEDQITPLLTQADNPRLNIFSVSYPKRKSDKDQVTRSIETETSPFTLFIMWAWSGSRYSGLVCMALASSVYCIMGILSDVFSAQAIPLFEIALARCIIVSALSFIWLRRSAQPIFGPSNVRSLFVSRAVTGCVSLIQKLPLSQAMLLSFTTPIMASVSARFILHENLKIAEIAGIALSFFGVIFILRSQGRSGNAREQKDLAVHGIHHVYVVLIGLLSSLAGGLSYCLIRAGAKKSEQPVGTIFSFGLLSSPAAAICMITFERFVLPSFYSLLLMILLGVLAFVAELFLARGLQLEKTNKVANIQYLEVALSELWGVASLRVTPLFGRLVGCLMILVSACCTMYLGPEKDME
ncbi:Drug/metabolite transporter [Cynara cardunculus var. scolymus]|uniref:Drug/metabolite transporter n=1 Tax=Cynara cardunculus var. scolymus TaxID=59895 RepID=A0A124SHU8_CYNCS|nr:Drug/metabolite transporter [Cynara cardunculus var. scolymus]